jgi:hypothetical protein
MIATMLLLVLSMQSGQDISLFDGRTLAGWTLENTSKEKVSVKNGAIRFEQGFGWLRSNREFKDFILKLEVRFLNNAANSGVFIRTAPTSDRTPAANGTTRGWPDDAYAVQAREIGNDSPTTVSPLAGKIMTFSGKSSPAKGIRFDAEAVRRAFKPMGEWQTYEIQCVGPRVTVKVNGVLISEDKIGRLSGHIGLQGEVGVVEYRNIFVKEIMSQ